MSERLRALIGAIDAINAADPHTLEVDGVEEPKELVHARMVTDWVQRFDPRPSEEQLIAARAHHLRRWAVPRSDYPDGRSGYLRWRRKVGERHRDEVAELMAEGGYDDSAIGRVRSIMAKRALSTDPAAQIHEDALCMVFLETQLDDLVERLGAEKAAEVIAKTLGKMSPGGIAAAKRVAYSESGRAAVGRALELFEAEV